MEYYFPHDLLRDIVGRLPPKSLMQFKSLTKQWPNLFFNSKFIISHLRDNKEFFLRFSDSVISRCKSDNTLYLSKLKTTSELEAKVVKSPLKSIDEIQDVGHCNGILCIFTGSYYGENDSWSAIIWNPLTQQHKRIPRKIIRSKWEAFGFGYDSVVHDYKVINITHKDASRRHWRKIQIFKLKTGSWEDAKDNVPYEFCILWENQMAIAVNGCLYWIAVKLGRKNAMHNVVLCFDLQTNNLREETSLCGNHLFHQRDSRYDSLRESRGIPKEDYILACNGSMLGLLEDTSLCLTTTFDGVYSDVWIMEENVVAKTKSWTKLFKIPKTCLSQRYPDVVDLYDPVYPICFTKKGKVIVSERRKLGISLFDSNDGSIYIIPINGRGLDSFDHHVISYVKSSVSF